MRTAALTLLLLIPACAAALGLFPDQNGPGREGRPAPWVSAGTAYSDAEGLAYRSLKAAGGTPVGRGLSVDASFSHHRILKDGWLPGELYTSGLRVSALRGRNMFSAGVRSNSDRPYGSVHETDFSLLALRKLNGEGPHSFSAGLMYSSRRSFARNIPFPFVSYSYRSEKFSFNFPFSAAWRPARPWELSAAYLPPKYYKAGVSAALGGKLKFKAEYSLTALQYDLAGRPDKDLSTFIEQANAGLWTFYKPSESYELSLWTGWALRGRYYSGETYDEHRDKVTLRSAPALSLSVNRLF